MSNTRRRFLPLLLTLPALTFSSASADELTLQGGSRIEGVVLEQPAAPTPDAPPSAETVAPVPRGAYRILLPGGDELRLRAADVKTVTIAPDAPKAGKYIRYREGASPAEEGLEVAVTHFVHPGGGPRIDLVGAVHIADASYFRAVQRWLDGCDAVLYEGVKAKDQSAADFAKATETPNPIRALQGKLATWFGLVFQLDAIDYTGPNFVHADLTAEEMGMKPALPDAARDGEASEGGESAGSEGESSESEGSISAGSEGGAEVPEAPEAPSPMGQLGGLLKTAGPMLDMLMKGGGPQRDMVKRTIAKQLGSADVGEILGQALPKEMTELLLDRRNAVVIQRLKEVRELKDVETIAVFYGAGHMADLEKTLIEGLGYRRAGGRWLRAWSMGSDAK